MKIEGSGALVAGGASGLGAATARALAIGGAAVTIADPETVSAAVDAAAQSEGGLRISVCCAGIGWAERLARSRGAHQLEPFSNVVRVNLIGTFNVLRLAAAA